MVAVVQARMSSRRFPGKVLAPFRGRPLVAHVIDAIVAALPSTPVWLATSVEPSDDPLASFVRDLGVRVVRGPLDDVVARFQLVAEQSGASHLLRICADSPLCSAVAIRRVAAAAERDREADLVTTTLRRTFPKGQNAEAIRADSLRRLSSEPLDHDDREHVTRYFHRHSDRFRVVGVESADPSLASVDLAVDTLDDLNRLEALSAAELASLDARAQRDLA